MLLSISGHQVQMCVVYCLSCLLTVLHVHLVVSLRQFFQSTAYHLGTHEQVNRLYFSEVLQFGYLPSRTDQHVALSDGTAVDHGEDVLSQEENLRGGDDCVAEEDVS